MTTKAEIKYQGHLMKVIEAEVLPGCMVQRTDAQQRPGIPDLLIIHGPRWAMLEVKMDESSPFEPNQKYYIEQFNTWSFCTVIFPAIEQEVLYALQQSLGAEW